MHGTCGVMGGGEANRGVALGEELGGGVAAARSARASWGSCPAKGRRHSAARHDIGEGGGRRCVTRGILTVARPYDDGARAL